MKYYAKCSTLGGNVILAVSGSDEEDARKNLIKTYNIVAILDIKTSEEYNFISQKEQFKNVANTYKKDKKKLYT
jgi:hypothetical protein